MNRSVTEPLDALKRPRDLRPLLPLRLGLFGSASSARPMAPEYKSALAQNVVGKFVPEALMRRCRMRAAADYPFGDLPPTSPPPSSLPPSSARGAQCSANGISSASGQIKKER